MASIGYTLMTEQAGPKDLVALAVAAERAGFDFAVSSDHYFPWLDEMGHAPNAWVTLGAVAQATSTIGLMTYVTALIFRYHPAVVAQQAATLQLISDNRFTLGLGAGENLNEHIVGAGWPGANTRQAKLVEAVKIINALIDGGYVHFKGEHYHVDSAKLWDLPDQQLPISWDDDVQAATKRAHQLFRWNAAGWKVNAKLPGTAAFDSASSFVKPDDIAEQIPCGNDVQAVVDAAKEFFDAGYTDLALVQIGGDQQERFFQAADRLLPALRTLQPADFAAAAR